MEGKIRARENLQIKLENGVKLLPVSRDNLANLAVFLHARHLTHAKGPVAI